MNIEQYHKKEYNKNISKNSNYTEENFYEYGDVNLSGNRLLPNRVQRDYFHKSFKRWLFHRSDNISDMGYLYQDNILLRSLSPVLYENSKLASFLFRLDGILTFCVDYVKTIKRSYLYTVPKDYKFFN